MNQSQLLWKEKKRRMSCLIITEHFEQIEKGFFQAEIRYSVHEEKKNVYPKSKFNLMNIESMGQTEPLIETIAPLPAGWTMALQL